MTGEHVHASAFNEQKIRLFEPVSLDELNERAALTERVDRKYLVPGVDVVGFLDHLAGSGARCLEIADRRQFGYLSDYFDTPELDFYRLAATHRRHRLKLRERVYLDSGLHFMELKTRGPRDHNVKDRLPLAEVETAEAERLANGAPLRTDPISSDPEVSRWFCELLVERRVIGDRCANASDLHVEPVLRTLYTRLTFLLPEDCRVTIDADLLLQSQSTSRNQDQMAGTTTSLGGHVVVETKSCGTPSEADRVLWRHGVRPVRISKFALGVACAHPELPVHRWNRVVKLARTTVGEVA